MPVPAFFALLAALAALAAAVFAPLSAEARPVLPPATAVAWPDAANDPAIPTAEQVLGYPVGAEIARHADVVRYFEALAAAAPERMKVAPFGKSWEGRSLIYGVIGAPENIARLSEIEAGMARLADPRKLAPGEADRLIATLPAVVWLSYSVHGNEPGTTDATLITAYHLLASKGDPRVAAMMKNTIVVIVPLQNPDGRERFISSNRAVRGLEPDPHPLSAERDEPWPGGRMNHYVFDMNRDWFTQTQPEMQAVAGLVLRFMPVLVADIHEMGTNQTYFFPPEADPLNPHLTKTQIDNVELIGRNNARWFDQFGLRYFTREVFDGFFPGYGSGWPNFQGASAMVYEQGSSRGLAARRADGTLVQYTETVQSQFIAALSAIEAVSDNRERFLRDFAAYRASAVAEGRREKVKAYVFAPGQNPDMAARLAATLAHNGIEVTRAGAAFKACGKSFPEGAYVVSAAQPTKRLIRTLMDEKTEMDPAFVKAQAARVAKGLPDEIYDVTAWSLPVMFGVETTPCTSAVQLDGVAVGKDWRTPGGVANPGAKVAFIAPWGDTASARFLAAAVRAGVKAFSANKPFTVESVTYPAGSLVIPVAGTKDLAARLQALAADTGARLTGVDSGWVSAGPGFGSPNMLAMTAPKVALIWDEPTERYSAGHARFVMERQFGYPVTLIRGARVASANLDGFDVILLPGEGKSYSDAFGKKGAETLKNWVRRGGVLIGLGSGTRWLADPKVDLLPIRLEDGVNPPIPGEGKDAAKPAEPVKADEDNGRVPGRILETEADLARATQAVKDAPRPVGGSLVRAKLDPEHWLGAGVQTSLNVLVTGGDIYAPAPMNEVDLVAHFKGPNEVLASGVLWEESRKQLAFKPFVAAKRDGRGVVVGFTADPNFRAHLGGLNLLFFNAVFRGAALAYDANSASGAGGEDQR